jgi:hypothetical protein
VPFRFNPFTDKLDLVETNLIPPVARFPITPYVVGPVGVAGYQTIQSALDAAHAASGGSVYVQPGIYTESLVLYGDTEVVGTPANSDLKTSGNTTRIVGVHTPPVTGSFTFANVSLESATDIFSSSAAGTIPLFLLNVAVTITNGFTFNLPNWTGTLITYNVGDNSTNNGMVNNSGGSVCFFISATHGAGTGQTMVTSGPVIMQEIDLKCPWDAQTGTFIQCDYLIFEKNVTCSNNSTGSFYNCRFSPGSSAALTMSSSSAISLIDCMIDSSSNPCIQGSGIGTLTLNDISFVNNKSIANTLTVATTGGTFPSGNLGSSGYVWTSNGPKTCPTFQPNAGTTYYSITPYIVGSDSHAQYTTISSAITQAVSDGASNTVQKNIYIKPGTYTESVALQPGINLIGFDEPANAQSNTLDGGPYLQTSVQIVGTVSLTGTSPQCKIQNLTLLPGSGSHAITSAVSASLEISSCYILTVGASDNIFNLTAGLSQIRVKDCFIQGSSKLINTANLTTYISFYDCDILTSADSTPGSSALGAAFNIAANNCRLTTNAANFTCANCVLSLEMNYCDIASSNSYLITAPASSGNISQAWYEHCILACSTGSNNLFNITSTSDAVPQLFYCDFTTQTDVTTTGGGGVNKINCTGSSGTFVINQLYKYYSGSSEFKGMASVHTTDATVTVLVSVAVNELESVTLTGNITGAQSNHTNAIGGDFLITARRASGGNVTLVGSPVTNVNSSSAATFAGTVDTGTQTVRITITGVAATVYNWVSTYEYQKVLTNA